MAKKVGVLGLKKHLGVDFVNSQGDMRKFFRQVENGNEKVEGDFPLLEVLATSS